MSLSLALSAVPVSVFAEETEDTAGTANNPFKLQNVNSDCSLTYEMYDQNTNVQDGAWYENGFLFVTFTGAVQDHTNQLRLYRNQLYGKDLAYLVGKKYTKARSDLFKKVSGIAGVANIPER